jgi:hypothetical protein
MLGPRRKRFVTRLIPRKVVGSLMLVVANSNLLKETSY